MNSLRKIFGFLMVMMVAAYALPAIAATPDKIFSVTATPSVLPAGQTTTVTVNFKNRSPGNSTINSLIINAPQGATITQVQSISNGTSTPPVLTAASTTSVSVINMASLKSSNQAGFTLVLSVFVPATTSCHLANWLGQAFTGNSFGGDSFGPYLPGADTPPASVGCDGIVACGGSFDASVNGAGPNDPGHALVTVGSTLKNGAACTGAMAYDATNTLVNGNNKLVVVLTDPNAAFTAQITSADLPVDASGYASLRVRVAWLQDGGGNWIYINAPTCLCSDALSSCMPVDTVNTDPPGYFGQPVKACVADYSWVLTGTVSGITYARYFATIIGVGNDPAMGWQ